MRASALWLGFRGVLWMVLLPGMYAGYVPWRFFGVSRVRLQWSDPMHLLGLTLAAAGIVLLVTCVAEFARSGGGTLSPADPPKALVVRGLYRYVRNPMYLSVTAIVLGEVLLTRSGGLLLYWIAWFTAVNIFVLGYEEPNLRQRFGAAYEDYTRRVGRWLPRLRPRSRAA